MPMINSQVTKLLSAIIATATGAAYVMPINTPYRAFSATVDGTGAVSATVLIEGSNDGVNFILLMTITLTGTTTDTNGAPSGPAPWAQVRARCTAISGTGATLTATVAI